MALTPKQRVFVIEYLRCWNGAEAARRAKVPAKSAYQMAWKWLRKVEVQNAIKEDLALRALEKDEVLGRLADQARGSLRPFVRVNSDGHIEFDFSSPEALDNIHLVKNIKTKTQRLTVGTGKKAKTVEKQWVEVELYNSQAALELIGKYHKLFTEKVEHAGSISIPGFEEALERAYGGRSKT